MECFVSGVCPYCKRDVVFRQSPSEDLNEQRAFELISSRTPKLVQQPVKNPYESFLKIMDDAASERINATNQLRDYFRFLELQANRVESSELSSLKKSTAKMSMKISAPARKEFESGKKRVLAIINKRLGGGKGGGKNEGKGKGNERNGKERKVDDRKGKKQ